jgi:hypothetical protein
MSTGKSALLFCALAFAAGTSFAAGVGTSSGAHHATAAGAQRFRDDLALCNERTGAEKQNCVREMYAARAQGLYND